MRRKRVSAGPARADTSATLKAVTRTMEALEALTGAADGLSVGELSAKLSVEKSVVSRILATLARGGYLRADERTGRFVPGLKFLTLASRFAWEQGFPGILLPALSDLARMSGETALLAVALGDSLHYVARARGSRSSVLESDHGPLELHGGAFGRAWLSALSDDEAARILRGKPLVPLTPRTIVDLERLREVLRRTRQLGYSIVQEEFLEGWSGLAAPILVADGRAGAVGAVGVIGLSGRLTAARMEALGLAVVEIARHIGHLWPLGLVRPVVMGGDPVSRDEQQPR